MRFHVEVVGGSSHVHSASVSYSLMPGTTCLSALSTISLTSAIKWNFFLMFIYLFSEREIESVCTYMHASQGGAEANRWLDPMNHEIMT